MRVVNLTAPFRLTGGEAKETVLLRVPLPRKYITCVYFHKVFLCFVMRRLSLESEFCGVTYFLAAVPQDDDVVFDGKNFKKSH